MIITDEAFNSLEWVKVRFTFTSPALMISG